MEKQSVGFYRGESVQTIYFGRESLKVLNHNLRRFPNHPRYVNDFYESGQINPEFRRRLEGVSEYIQLKDPDVALFQELCHDRVLEMLNDNFLDGQYQVLYFKPTRPRALGMGAVIKKGTTIRSVRTLSDFDVQAKEKPVTRDVPVIELMNPNVFLIPVHLKSGGDGADYVRKYEEMNQIIEVLKQLRQEAPNTPIILAGDFNIPSSSPHWHSIRETITSMTDLTLVNFNDDSQEAVATHVSGFQYDYMMTLGLRTLNTSVDDKSVKAVKKITSDHHPLYGEFEVMA